MDLTMFFAIMCRKEIKRCKKYLYFRKNCYFCAAESKETARSFEVSDVNKILNYFNNVAA